MVLSYYFIIGLCLVVSIKSQTTQKPNIIIIISDDLGRNDVSFNANNENIVTPNIDALGYFGIILNRFYVHPMCTPSRGALMTGKYCTHTGLQHGVIANDEPYGMSPQEKTLPQYLKSVGYATHLVGKWHLGMSKREYNPMKRGFDSFYGYLGGYITYYDHCLCMPNHPFWPPGFDLRSGETPDRSTIGQHATDLFTSKAREVIHNHDTSQPLFLMVNHLAVHAENFCIPFPPSEECLEYWYLLNPIQKRLAGQISKLDKSVGSIIEALDEKNLLQNSVVVFISDNGAPSLGELYTFGSNYPLKGQKDSGWEGAIRVPGIIWSPLFNNTQYVSDRLIHITDLFTTLVTLGGAAPPGELANIQNNILHGWGALTNGNNSVDGLDIWEMISNNSPYEVRDRIVHNIDDYTSYLKGDWKYVKGTTYYSVFDFWIGHTIQHDCLINPHKFTYHDDVKNSVVAKILQKYSSTKEPLQNNNIDGSRYYTKIWCGNKPINFCKPWIRPCLFNIRNDPCEHENLYFQYPEKVWEMEQDIQYYSATIVAKRNQATDYNANPATHEFLWTWWQDGI